MALTLYTYSGDADVPSISPPCAKVLLALRLLDLSHEAVLVKSALELKRVSPTGRLPVLHVDGTPLVDSPRILDVLDERSEQSLAPRDPRARARDQVWERFADDALYWRGLYLRWLAPGNRPRTIRALFGAGLRGRLFGALLTRRVRQRCRAQGVGLRSELEVRDELERMLATAEAGLAGGPFLEGRAAPGRGDLALASFVVQVGWQGIDLPLLERLRARPPLLEHLRQTLSACRTPLPSWL